MTPRQDQQQAQKGQHNSQIGKVDGFLFHIQILPAPPMSTKDTYAPSSADMRSRNPGIPGNGSLLREIAVKECE